MNPTFNIQAVDINTPGADLFLMIDANGLSFIILEEKVSRALVIYHFEPGISNLTAMNHISDIIAVQPVLQQQFKRVHIIYGYPSSILVPQQFINSNTNAAMLELVFGDMSNMEVRTELLKGKSLTNIYGVPVEIEQVLARNFQFAEYSHVFSLLPDITEKKGDQLYCIFGTGQLKAILIKGGSCRHYRTSATKPPKILFTTC